MTIRQRLEDLRRAWWVRKCRSIGIDVRLEGRPTIEVYGGEMSLGDQFRLASHPIQSHLAVGPKGVLKIGSNVSIAHGAAIAAFERIEIGSGTIVGPFVIIMDTNFHGSAGDQSVRHDCRPVIIGSGCRIGSRVTITRGASIGDGAEILAGSVVSSAIPPGARAGGARARVLGPAAEPFYQWGNAHDGTDPR